MEKEPVSSIAKLEKILGAVFLLLGVVAVTGILLLIRQDSRTPYVTEAPQQEETEAYDWEAGLSDSTYWLPENCSLYRELPDISFTGEDEKAHSISQWQGKNVVLVYWASWCEDCGSQMANMRSFEERAAQYNDVEFLYLNRTDGSRETRETAKTYFDSLSLGGTLAYDVSEEAYDILGIHNIPTTLFLDREGRVRAWSPKQIEDANVFEALLQTAVEGNAAPIGGFVTACLMDQSGGIHSSYHPSGQPDMASEVLSESQGLGLLYACSIRDQALFERLWDYVRQYMWQDGLCAWRVQDKEAGNVNALIDDLRIYRALSRAQELWGGYENALASMEDAMASRMIVEDKFTDFYDFDREDPASRFTLCYGDLEAMELLFAHTGNAVFDRAAGTALELMERGQISDEFPLYYSWYNYDSGRYERDDLNTAEAMLTLLHLAQEGRLKNNTIRWLKTRMDGEGLFLRYTVKGDVAKGYRSESTAVYAIVAMIADEIGDEKLLSQSLKKMEKLHIQNTALAYNGAYGMEDGSGITSFDQLMPLTAYCQLNERDAFNGRSS